MLLLLFFTSQVYVDFFLPVLWDNIYGYILAGLVFVLTIRLLQVLGYNQRITMLATVLARSGHALFGFSLVFFVIISAYVWAGHLLFVTSLQQFRSVLDTYSTLYIVLLGKNKIGHWISGAPLGAQAYFISLTFLVVFILYTMFQVEGADSVPSFLCLPPRMSCVTWPQIPPPHPHPPTRLSYNL